LVNSCSRILLWSAGHRRARRTPRHRL